MTLEERLDEAIASSEELIQKNELLLASHAPIAEEWVALRPRNLGFLDAYEGMTCSPSMYYHFNNVDKYVEYIVYYLTVRPNNLGALVLCQHYRITVERDGEVIDGKRQTVVISELDCDVLEAIVKQDEVHDDEFTWAVAA